jgi:predicted transcriptional regulator
MKLLQNNGATFARMGRRTSAAQIMTPQPLSINDDVHPKDAAAFLTRRRIGAAPVIDKAGRPVGVISLSDIARHICRDGEAAAPAAPTTVRDVMTPGVLFIRPDTAIENIVDDLLKLGIHRMFVLDSNNVLVGVISTLDVLRHLRAMTAPILHPNMDF